MSEQNEFVPDPDMLRRAAKACRSIKEQASGRVDWFDWVPAYLDKMAARAEAAPPEAP